MTTRASRVKYNIKRNEARRLNGIPTRTVFASEDERKLAKLAARKRWEAKNPERIKNIRNEWRRRNKERVTAQTKARQIANPEQYKAHYTRANAKLCANLQWRVSNRIRCRMWQTLRAKKGRNSWSSFVSYSRDDLIAHLQSLFTDGMSWDRFLNAEIEIDHIRPIASFNYDSPSDSEFSECWALSNLRPLWRTENRRLGGATRRTQKVSYPSHCA